MQINEIIISYYGKRHRYWIYIYRWSYEQKERKTQKQEKEVKCNVYICINREFENEIEEIPELDEEMEMSSRNRLY